MLPEPLHPAIVHFPIALAVLLPIAIAWGFLRSGKNGVLMAWAPALALSALLAISSTVAAETGEDEEEMVEQVVTEQVLEEHEEAAELFQRASIGVLLLVAAGLVQRLPERVGKAFRVAALVGSLVLLPLMIRTGHTGGNLVYEHGAALVYSGGSTLARPAELDDD